MEDLPGICGGRLPRGMVILALAVLTAGCGRVTAPGSTGSAADQAASGARSLPVAWVDSTAPNAAQPFTIPGIPPCRATDLDVKVQGIYVGGGPKDTSTWQIWVKNKGARPCFVGSTVDVSFSTATGRLNMSPVATRGDIIYLAGVAGPTSPRLSRQASGEIDTFCHMPPVLAMQISPAAGLGTVAVNPGPAGGWGPVCPNPEGYLAELYPDDCCTGYTTSTQTTIDAPATVHPGDHVRFLIGIKNEESVHSGLGGSVRPSPTPLTFAPCPTYHIELEGVPDTLHTYTLNCRNVAPIQPHQTATFEMYIDVPKNAHAGPSVLVWSVDGSPRTFQTARTSIEIVS